MTSRSGTRTSAGSLRFELRSFGPGRKLSQPRVGRDFIQVRLEWPEGRWRVAGERSRAQRRIAGQADEPLACVQSLRVRGCSKGLRVGRRPRDTLRVVTGCITRLGERIHCKGRAPEFVGPAPMHCGSTVAVKRLGERAPRRGGPLDVAAASRLLRRIVAACGRITFERELASQRNGLCQPVHGLGRIDRPVELLLVPADLRIGPPSGTITLARGGVERCRTQLAGCTQLQRCPDDCGLADRLENLGVRPTANGGRQQPHEHRSRAKPHGPLANARHWHALLNT